MTATNPRVVMLFHRDLGLMQGQEYSRSEAILINEHDLVLGAVSLAAEHSASGRFPPLKLRVLAWKAQLGSAPSSKRLRSWCSGTWFSG